MFKHFKVVISITAALGLAFMFMACGGSSGGGSVTYSGNTDPAVADSTTAATLAEYGMGATEAGFPIAQMFVVPPEAAQNSLAVQRLAPYPYMTTIDFPVPGDAIIDGADYSPAGTGTARIKGTMSLIMGNDISDTADTWYVVSGDLDGSIVFDNFRVDEGPAVDGTVTVSSGIFTFSGIAEFSMSEGNLTGDPGFPLWDLVEMTFTNITISEDGESWSVGEGDWVLDISIGEGADLNINSQTVEYDGSTYKIEDTNVFVEFYEIVPLAEPLIVEPIDRTSIDIGGIVTENGAFYHPDLGLVYFNGSITEDDPPDAIVQGALYFYDDPSTEGTLLFTVYFEWDDLEGETAYWIDMEDGSYDEFGYFVDGSFTPDPTAAGNFE